MPDKTRRARQRSSGGEASGSSSAQDFGSNAAVQERLNDQDVPDKFKETATGKLTQSQATGNGGTRVWYRLRNSPDLDPYWTAFLDGGALVLFLPGHQVEVRGSEVSFVVDLSKDTVDNMDRVAQFIRGKHD